MIYPTSSDILRCVNQTLLSLTDEQVSHTAVKSAVATSRHLIRHVEIRIRLERSILLDDIGKTTALLKKIVVYFELHARHNSDLTHGIRAVLDETMKFPSVDADEFESILARAKTLRELIYAALSQLQKAVPAVKANQPYGEIREAIRGYMRYQIEQEDKLIQPSFSGKGPRR